MPYITVRQSPRRHQITLEEILRGAVPMTRFDLHVSGSGTTTHITHRLSSELMRSANVPALISALDTFVTQYAHLYEVERQSLYRSFYIPKRSGGLRRIDAPCEELMAALRQLKEIFEDRFGALYHTSAFAYVPRRCPVDAVKRHQQNNSRWFLKLDFENFFGSTSEDFLFRMISKIFPFSEVARDHRGEHLLHKVLNLCLLNGGLPQGTPISPMLTNLMMIPIDHELFNSLSKRSFVYTRYADDILISSRTNFPYRELEADVNACLEKFEAPFRIKQKKTRYGSSNGQNWNLGVMLNKDNEITIGRKKKERFKAMCHGYISGKKSGQPWDLHDVQVFAGLISYYKSVEPGYISEAISHINKKFEVNLMQLIRADLNGGC